MVVTTAYCDRCKAAIRDRRSEMDVLSGPLAEGRDSIDLCGPCAADLARWLDAPSMGHAPAGPRIAGVGR